LSYQSGDTIAALATAPGSAAVAIVRISGPSAGQIAAQITGIDPEPRRAHFCQFRDEKLEPIDRGLVIYFPGPHSFTGEDVVELQGHGGTVVSDMLLASVLGRGARAAEPGEFTLRAFLNDKLDLTQAEGIADLVSSGSREAALAAYRSLDGRFSALVQRLQTELTELRVKLEAWLDFPEEELAFDDSAIFEQGLSRLVTALETLLLQAREGAVLANGLVVVIAGAANAGKSSLMNRLSGIDAAIVTDIPGTTRDTLTQQLSIEGLPITIVDTAGLRQSEDPVELEGIRRAHLALESADRLVWVSDIRADPAAELAALRRVAGEAANVVIVQNKVDLSSADAELREHEGITTIRLSALTGEGVGLLTEHLKALAGYRSDTVGTFSARTRHIDALQRAEQHVRDAGRQLLSSQALELAAEDLRSAQAALSELTGELTSDDLLGEIFSSFCIGK
jgi:tRNA modification GTPase